jgi:hypothetical protein
VTRSTSWLACHGNRSKTRANFDRSTRAFSVNYTKRTRQTTKQKEQEKIKKKQKKEGASVRSSRRYAGAGRRLPEHSKKQ